jgi:hypothetical protein
MPKRPDWLWWLALARLAAVRRPLPAVSGFRRHPIVRRGLPVIGLVLMPGLHSDRRGQWLVL